MIDLQKKPMTEQDEKAEYAEFPEFFKGMATAYADCATFIDTMRDNLPPELEVLADGFTTISDGIRGKIDHLQVIVARNMAMADKAKGETEQ